VFGADNRRARYLTFTVRCITRDLREELLCSRVFIVQGQIDCYVWVYRQCHGRYMIQANGQPPVASASYVVNSTLSRVSTDEFAKDETGSGGSSKGLRQSNSACCEKVEVLDGNNGPAYLCLQQLVSSGLGEIH
jgi:hypothetical protein